MQGKRPRQWAHDLTEAWIDCQCVEPILSRIPAADKPLARTHARIHCENILHHAKHTADLEPLGPVMAEWVKRYRARRNV